MAASGRKPTEEGRFFKSEITDAGPKLPAGFTRANAMTGFLAPRSKPPFEIAESSFFPYSDVLKHVAEQKYNRYKVSKTEYFVHYQHKRSPATAKVGFKWHILIPAQAMKNVWDCLLPLFHYYQVDSFKIRHPEVTLSHQKEVTVYQFANPEKTADQWYEIMKKVEEILNEANCVPGVLPPANKMITGSKFISYRNDSSVDGSYIKDEDAVAVAALQGLEAHNLTGADDIFAGIDLSRSRFTFGRLS